MQPWMAFAVPLVTALRAIRHPALTAMASQRTPTNAQGELQEIIASANGLGAIVSPLVFSYSFAWATSGADKKFLSGTPFLIATNMALGALLLILFSKRVKQ